MKQLNEVAILLYGKPYNELEPHQQYDVRETINNPDYQQNIIVSAVKHIHIIM